MPSQCNYDIGPKINSCEDESEMRENTPHIGVELEIQGFNRDEFCKRLMNLFTDDFFYHIQSADKPIEGHLYLSCHACHFSLFYLLFFFKFLS